MKFKIIIRLIFKYLRRLLLAGPLILFGFIIFNILIFVVSILLFVAISEIQIIQISNTFFNIVAGLIIACLLSVYVFISIKLIKRK